MKKYLLIIAVLVSLVGCGEKEEVSPMAKVQVADNQIYVKVENTSLTAKNLKIESYYTGSTGSITAKVETMMSTDASWEHYFSFEKGKGKFNIKISREGSPLDEDVLNYSFVLHGRETVNSTKGETIHIGYDPNN